ncbi:unannotated protein [freshwater metagenome]|uniref:Unannotated protein n=1 Tax=freshwater metagenome TaxID=449393 RepID=A0A6J7APD3_9ZZZZ
MATPPAIAARMLARRNTGRHVVRVAVNRWLAPIPSNSAAVMPSPSLRKLKAAAPSAPRPMACRVVIGPRLSHLASVARHSPVMARYGRSEPTTSTQRTIGSESVKHAVEPSAAASGNRRRASENQAPAPMAKAAAIVNLRAMMSRPKSASGMASRIEVPQGYTSGLKPFALDHSTV